MISPEEQAWARRFWGRLFTQAEAVEPPPGASTPACAACALMPLVEAVAVMFLEGVGQEVGELNSAALRRAVTASDGQFDAQAVEVGVQLTHWFVSGGVALIEALLEAGLAPEEADPSWQELLRAAESHARLMPAPAGPALTGRLDQLQARLAEVRREPEGGGR